MSLENWITVCNESDLVENSGVCALVGEEQIALFKVNASENDAVYAIGNWDPCGEANVLSRGIVGSLNDSVVVASPLYKQHFCLASGRCLEDDSKQVPVYQARVVNEQVQLLVAG